MKKFIVTLTDDQGTILDRWELERPQENCEDSWLTRDGKIMPLDAMELGKQIGVEINKVGG